MRVFVGLLGLPAVAHAHAPGYADLHWSFEPWVVFCLTLSAALYGIGLARVWLKAGARAGISGARAVCFSTGLVTVAIALMSPLDSLGGYLFSAHMAQHEILMIVAAPLLVLGKPLAVWSWALPASFNKSFAGASAFPLLAWTWSVVSYAPCAWALHAIAIWAWHVPSLFDAALDNENVHTLQHLSFFLSALLFWWAPLGATSRTQQNVSLIYLFTTMLHTTILGALLTMAPTAWYPGYAGRTETFGLAQLEDQQLGGLIMWVPGSISYLVASLAIAWQSLKGKNDCLEPQASR